MKPFLKNDFLGIEQELEQKQNTLPNAEKWNTLIKEYKTPLSEVEWGMADPLFSKADIQVIRPLTAYGESCHFLVFWARKIIRKLIFWYIAPLVRDQNAYNRELLFTIKRLEKKVAELEEKIGGMKS